MPDETRTIPRGRTDIWNLGDLVAGRIVFEPGWQCSKDVNPIAQTELEGVTGARQVRALAQICPYQSHLCIGAFGSRDASRHEPE
ncbi:MAG: hypothetical protein ABI864_06740 [Chloroflexota bacterium]